jgi:succinoglycan biosynthesis protein ExoV
MKVIYYRSANGNFGDDLNAVLWKEVLSQACFDVDDAVLLGVGSIFRDDFLSKEATDSKRVFVLGSGAGTGPLPARWPNEDWSILGVRGPLTAGLIGMPQAAMTDSAALIATVPAMQPKAGRRREVAFMPHYNSVLYSRWRDICADLGFVYIDAHWPVERVMAQLGEVRLLITEAMHGAIVADTLRIPWIPAVCSPAILPFKWVDWTESLDLDYRPVTLPPSSAWEALKNIKIRTVDGDKGMSSLSDRDRDILDDFHRRFGNVASDDLMPKKVVSRGVKRRLQQLTEAFDGMFAGRAAQALEAASKSHPYLSKDGIFFERVERLQVAVANLERALLGPPH